MRHSTTSSILLGFLSLAAAAPLTITINSDCWTKESWDVIVVGSGPAGIIVADRERPDWLNGTDLSRVDVPGLYNTIFDDGGHLVCGNLTNAYGGCTIGGSSAINAGLFFEPPAFDFDTYFPEGWKHADVKASIDRLYARQPEVHEPETSMNNKDYLDSFYDVAKAWLVDGAGYAEVDINGEAALKTKVFGRTIYDYENGQRGGPVTTYLQSALSRPHFQLQHGVRVQRVVRDGSQATGVVAMVNGQEKTINLNPNGRVVLSGGAIQSPQILMYSAIGEPETLTKLQSAGILGDVPATSWINSTSIGAGLFDNPNTFIELQSSSLTSYTYNYSSPPADDQALYLNERSGPYAFAGQTSVFWTTLNHTDGTVTGLQGTIGTAGYSDYTNQHTTTLNIYGTSGLLSTGRVVLDANNVPGPSDDVYYSDTAGRDAQDIAQFIRDIFDALPADLEPLNIARNASVDEIKTYITTTSAYAKGQVNHWSSSCRIGSCVDANAQVIGTDNVHVVDASIVAPLTVNPQFGIMVAAERASELILKL
ncbi:GMC oxidoreductase [Saccharata proteae CBS 121410]|uniref:GMC oxidoreductase n=1 Tax=Saccharata proteae CBS 121410 TaxID=1314787 RepID=A0A9P4LVK3_9PEZI|nr:GMC oxidoreductase [Saccharata proteae CBS 121410]